MRRPVRCAVHSPVDWPVDSPLTRPVEDGSSCTIPVARTKTRPASFASQLGASCMNCMAWPSLVLALPPLVPSLVLVLAPLVRHRFPSRGAEDGRVS